MFNKNIFSVLFALLIISSLAFATTTVAITVPSAGADLNRLDVYQDINFTITSDDSNSFLIDINYSLVNTQGSGTVIINDVNTYAGSVICNTAGFQDFTAGISCRYIWNFSSVDYNSYFINISATGDATEGFDPINTAITISSTYTPAYASTDIATITIDFIGSVMATMVDNVAILVTLIILGIIVFLTRDIIRNLLGSIMGIMRK